jgi:hypothetical protein
MGLFGSEQSTTSSGTQQTFFDPRSWQEDRINTMGFGVLQNLFDETGKLPPGLSFGALAMNPIDQLFGGPAGFKAMLENPDVTPAQKAAIEQAYTTSYDVARSRETAAMDDAGRRTKLATGDLVSAFRDRMSAGGGRGTSAGYGDILRGLQGIGADRMALESQFGAQRDALGREMAGGMASASLQYPFQQKQMMLQGLGSMLQERQGRAAMRGYADAARSTLLGNDLVSRLLSERMAGGKTVQHSKSTTKDEGSVLGGIAGLGTNLALNYFTGGGYGAAKGALGATQSFGQSLYGSDDAYSNAYSSWLGGGAGYGGGDAHEDYYRNVFGR